MVVPAGRPNRAGLSGESCLKAHLLKEVLNPRTHGSVAPSPF